MIYIKRMLVVVPIVLILAACTAWFKPRTETFESIQTHQITPLPERVDEVTIISPEERESFMTVLRRSCVMYQGFTLKLKSGEEESYTCKRIRDD